MIILTGASGGIGTSILTGLSKIDKVIALYNKNIPLNLDMSDVDFVKVDLTDEKAIKNFTDKIKNNIAEITLVHSAAISQDNLAWQFDLNDWQAVMDANLKGPFLLTKELLFTMMKQSWGRIIHFSSIAATQGKSGTLAYSTTKMGILGMSRVLAREYGRFGITSNVIMPGYLNTGLINTLSEDERKEILRTIPSGKFGDSKNVINAIEFIIKSDYVNGTCLRIDGGIL